jgi:uncharacterized membrane protein YebE (DUF533 family)
MDSKALLDQILQAGQALANHGLQVIQDPAVQEKIAKGQAIAQEKIAQGQAMLNDPAMQEKIAKGQAILQEKIAQGQAVLKEKLAQGQSLAEEKLGVQLTDAQVENMGKGAAVAALGTLLLGTGFGRRITGAALKVGTVAAIGKLGYDAFQNWQAAQGNAISAGKPIGELPEAEANQRSLALLKAMIAAAKADGHIDAEEQATIKAQIEHLGLSSPTTDILQSEMQKALDVNALAQLADSPAAAVEMYLVSRLVINVESGAERQYLTSLATALNLAPELVSQLEAGAA